MKLGVHNIFSENWCNLCYFQPSGPRSFHNASVWTHSYNKSLSAATLLQVFRYLFSSVCRHYVQFITLNSQMAPSRTPVMKESKKKLESQAACSWASLSVWLAVIPLLGLPQPIMMCLCDWEGSWDHLPWRPGASYRCVQEAPLFPSGIQTINKKHFLHPPLFCCVSTLRQRPPARRASSTSPHPFIQNPSILRCVSSAFSPEAKQQRTCFVSIFDFFPGRTLSYSHLCNFLH